MRRHSRPGSRKLGTVIENSLMPGDQVLLIPDLLPDPHESFEAFSARLAQASVLVINVGNPGEIELTTLDQHR